MTSNHRTVAITLAALLVLSVTGPALVMAQESELEIDVEQDDDVLVTVSDDNGTVENASVNVTVDDENATYDGAGDYLTDENGTVALTAPNETVNVTITAEHDNANASTSETLEAAEDGDEEADESEMPFGQRVQEFVHGLLDGEGDENKTVGQQVAAFVTANNPGNAPAHAGPPEDPGNQSDAERGPPEHAGNDGDAGPPEHAGNGGDAGPSEDGDDADEQEGDDEEETETETEA